MDEGRRTSDELAGYARHVRQTPGAFVRHIGVAVGPSEARAVLEDDFHHFRVTVSFEAGRVVAIAGEALRYPWTTCGQAGEALVALIGLELAESASAVQARIDPGAQCTHLLELAGLAIAVAAQAASRRAYRMIVTDADADGRRRAAVERDGWEVLGWDLRDGRIEAPEPFVDRPLGRGFSAWASSTLPAGDAEAAILLRRAVHISGGRSVDLDALERPFRIVPCFTLSEPRILEARRVKGSSRDFSNDPQAPARADADWLEALDPIDSRDASAQKRNDIPL